MARSHPFLIESRAEKGHASLCIKSNELLGGCLDGDNGHGLTVALLSLLDLLVGSGAYRTRRRSGVGLLEVRVPRLLLGTCGNADEARRALAVVPQFYLTIPCLYLIADRWGDAFVWSHAARLPDRYESMGRPWQPLVITNHFPEHLIADVPPRTESIERPARLCAAVNAAGARPNLASIRRAAECVAATQPPGVGQ